MSTLSKIVSLLALIMLTANARADLTADECVIIYRLSEQRGSTPGVSESIARHYAKARGVPLDHLLGIELPNRETLPRKVYDATVRPAVRRFLAEKSWGSKIRCLVTCYGVPLRIGAHHPSEAQRKEADALQVRLAQTRKSLRGLIDEMRRDRSAKNDAPDLDTVEQLFEQYRAEQIALARRLDMSAKSRRRSFDVIFRAEGRAGIVNRARVPDDVEDASSAIRIEAMRKRVKQAGEKAEPMIAYGSSHQEFTEALQLVRENAGLFGVAALVRKRITTLLGEKSTAAFDSELALVLWPPYSPAGWQPNLLKAPVPTATVGDATHKTLLVSRLDGPTPEIVHKIIDTSVEVERRGLRGSFYIDARGLRKGAGYVEYDRDLARLGAMIKKADKMPITVDRRPEVFQPGTCPNAAVYTGWYSLKNYVDAFDFVPGAVAVHIASFELVSLRDPKKRYWCQELLKDGVVATFGATSEPFLESFPLPSEFFGLLLTGKYTLAEVFFATQTHTSWKLALIGDPLYNPFKNNPMLTEDAITDPPR
jgi:uncharacterized protein (TIGR03790 family)